MCSYFFAVSLSLLSSQSQKINNRIFVSLEYTYGRSEWLALGLNQQRADSKFVISRPAEN